MKMNVFVTLELMLCNNLKVELPMVCRLIDAIMCNNFFSMLINKWERTVLRSYKIQIQFDPILLILLLKKNGRFTAVHGVRDPVLVASKIIRSLNFLSIRSHFRYAPVCKKGERS